MTSPEQSFSYDSTNPDGLPLHTHLDVSGQISFQLSVDSVRPVFHCSGPVKLTTLVELPTGDSKATMIWTSGETRIFSADGGIKVQSDGQIMASTVTLKDVGSVFDPSAMDVADDASDAQQNSADTELSPLLLANPIPGFLPEVTQPVPPRRRLSSLPEEEVVDVASLSL
ncbi:hypothetical protein JAAARDRAFT_195497 [Jaapia argillacea MUCL 33604]|uniref:Uncharacterized protein n=1 Tax=Jaapia argillacea MUCL 33604 TaxID=933084 RepID=A0A067PPC6_9AGAM|nr:hypothetical protein JAAARDRAFT_195497 [Jaapia argillacea MUCL 33604]